MKIYRGTVTAAITGREKAPVAAATRRAVRAVAELGLRARGDVREVRAGAPTILSAVPEAVDRIRALRREGHSITEIARRLTALGIPAAKGGRSWHPKTVSTVVRELEAQP